MSNIKELLNKGVPISTPVLIRSTDLIKNSKDSEKTLEKIREEFSKYLIGIKKYGYDEFEVFMNFSITSDPKTLEKKLRFSEYGLIGSLIYNLNIDNVCTDASKMYNMTMGDVYDYIDENKEKFNIQIEKLKHINNERKFEKKYPFLYKQYKRKKDYYDSIKYLIQQLNSSKISELVKLDIYSKLLTNYGKTKDDIFKDLEDSKKFNLESYCNNIANIMTNMINNYKDIIDYSFNENIDIETLDIDKDKFELLIVYSFIRQIQIINPNDKQRYIYYVQDYFEQNPDKKTSLEPEILMDYIGNDMIDENIYNGRKITPKDVYEEYQNILINNPNIELMCLNKIDYSNMDLKEVEEFVMEYLKNFSANWELIPEEKLNQGKIDEIAEESRYLSEEEKRQKAISMYKLFMDKKEFYASLDPFYRIKGLNTFKGYVGFIYPNGKVVLDKFFKNKKSNKVSDGDAIYIMSIEDFYRLSHFPKRVLMNDDKVTRVVHMGDWKTRVLNEITGNATYETVDEVKKLIKRGSVEGDF